MYRGEARYALQQIRPLAIRFLTPDVRFRFRGDQQFFPTVPVHVRCCDTKHGLIFVYKMWSSNFTQRPANPLQHPSRRPGDHHLRHAVAVQVTHDSTDIPTRWVIGNQV